MASNDPSNENANLTPALVAVDDVRAASTENTQEMENKGTKIQADDTKRDNLIQKNEAVTVTSIAGDNSKPVTSPAVGTASPSKHGNGAIKTTPSPRKPQSDLLRFPIRVGITWRKGEKLEAMDFSKTWYPSKIVEIDESEKCVLIHFDGWNSRYDEWVPMDSDKLRPQTRHSERKEKKGRNLPQPIFRPGEGVLARWTDCKKYPAKISRLMEDGTFEVFFYDGVRRNVQPINVQPLPEELKHAAESIQIPQAPYLSASVGSPPAVKTSFKSLKLELPESVVQRAESNTCSVSLKKLPGVERKNRHMEKSIKKSLAHISGSFKKSPLKAHRLKALQGSSKKTFKTLESPPSAPPAATLSAVSAPAPAAPPPPAAASSQPPPVCPSSSSSSSSLSSSPVSSSSSLTMKAAPTQTSPYQGATVVSSSTTGKLKMVLKLEHSPDRTHNVVKPAVSSDAVKPQGETTLPAGAKRVKKRSNTDPALSPRKKKKKKMKEAGLVATPRSQRASSLNDAAVSSAAAALPQYFVPSKAFVVEEDHNPYKCSYQGCTKEFRKEVLLTSHVKYYHNNPESQTTNSNTNNTLMSSSSSTPTSTTAGLSSPPPPPPPPVSSFSPSVICGDGVGVGAGFGGSSPYLQTPLTSPLSSSSSSQTNLNPQQPVVVPSRRRRRKTDSFCSTDSDVSVSSRGKSSHKRQRHDSEISVTGSPDLLSRDLWADVKLKAPQDSLVEDYGETEEEDVESDFVNCVCQIRETNGLMIQCDVCMCWQHFTCVDTEGSGRPPANYVCLACERPKDVRDSCRYLYDMGWERRGELPSFPFLGETARGRNSTQRLTQVAGSCIPLTSALMGIKSVLHSTRRQIKISKEEDEPEFQLWQTDWDNWTKPEEDLTLTPPRSVEAAPSPAPSTFMFPPAQNSPPLPPTTPSSASLPDITSSYQDSFKSWLCTTENATSKTKSSLSSPLKIKTEPLITTTTTQPPSVEPPPALPHSSHNDNSCFSRQSDITTTTATPISPPLGNTHQLQRLHQASNILTPPLRLGQSQHQTQTPPPPSSSLSCSTSHTEDKPTTTISTSSQPQQSLTTSPPPQLTPPMKIGMAPPQTPSSVRSSSRISSSGAAPTDGSNDAPPSHQTDNPLQGFILPGPGGDAGDSMASPSLPRAFSIQSNKEDTEQDQEQSRMMTSQSILLSSSSSSSLRNLPLLSLANSETTSATSVSPSNTVSSQSSTLTSRPLSNWSQSSITPTVSLNINGGGGVEDLLDGGCEPMNTTPATPNLTLDEGGKGSEDGRRSPSSPPSSSSLLLLSEQPSGHHGSHRALQELYVDVNGGGDSNSMMNNGHEDADDDNDNDTDTAEESVDPYRDCERNLLIHITRTHGKIESQLEDVEKQIEELEEATDQSVDHSHLVSGETILNDVPALNKSLEKLVRCLGKIQHLSMYQ